MSSLPLRFEDVPALLAQLKRDRFYGRISFEFHNGEVRLMRKEETRIIEGETREQYRNFQR